MNSVTIEIVGAMSPLVLKASQLLQRHIEEQTGIPVAAGSKGQIVLSVRPGMGTDGYAIEDGPGGSVAIVGNDERGVIYGVGKFIRTSHYAQGGFTPSAWRGTSVPKRPVRGIYFASHFFNFYHAAPVAAVQRYVEELALWGCNTLAVWFDMHHFNGMADPAAKDMVQRLRMILQAANTVGITGALTTLANEGYNDSPEAIRADWTAGHDGYTSPPGGHYHREICPRKPGGLDYIIKTRREMLNAFADLNIEYVWMWPYDQGGCTCSECTPWGANGLLACAKPYAKLVREIIPKAKVILSTWYFDHFIKGEWEAFAKAVGKDKPEYADLLMVDDYGDHFPQYPLEHGVPGGLPMVTFPEISMYNMWPWGGYGANPLPRHLQHIWDVCGKHVAGGFPYSEGIFEDLNKAVNLQHYWGDRDAMDTVREYAAYVASPEVAEEVTAAVEIMEHNHQFQHATKGLPEPLSQAKSVLFPPDGGPSKSSLVNAPEMPKAAACLKLIEAAEKKMTSAARAGWRWRLLKLRAQIDVDLQRTKGFHDAISDGLYKQVEDIYFAHRGEFVVSPPSRQMFVRCFLDNKPSQL